MGIHLLYVLHNVIGQLQTSSHKLEIEVGRYALHTSRRKNLPIVSSSNGI